MPPASPATGGPPWIRAIGDADFEAEVLRSPRPVLVDFRIDDCRPCRLLEPLLEELAAAYVSSVQIVSVDTETHPLQARRFHVSSVPTLILFAGGAERQRLVGVLPRPLLELWLRRALAS